MFIEENVETIAMTNDSVYRDLMFRVCLLEPLKRILSKMGTACTASGGLSGYEFEEI